MKYTHTLKDRNRTPAGATVVKNKQWKQMCSGFCGYQGALQETQRLFIATSLSRPSNQKITSFIATFNTFANNPNSLYSFLSQFAMLDRWCCY
jgi:hypothetical protein